MTADDLGPRIRIARRRKRWSQQRLADELGVALRTVGAWERGEVANLRYQEAVVDDLQRLLGVDLSTDPPAEERLDSVQDEYEQELWRTGLPPDDVRKLVGFYRRSIVRRSA